MKWWASKFLLLFVLWCIFMTCSFLLCGPQRQLLRAARPLQLQVQRRTWLGSIADSSLYHRKHNVSDLRAASTWSHTCTFLVYADALWQARQYEQNLMNFHVFFFNCHRHTPENLYVNKDIPCNFIQHTAPVSLSAERNYVAISYIEAICLPQSHVCKLRKYKDHKVCMQWEHMREL